MPFGAPRWTIPAALVLLLVCQLVPTSSAAPTHSNQLTVQVYMAGGAQAASGIRVNLTVGATGVVCVTQTQPGGFADFLNSSSCPLYPGWYTASIPPQTVGGAYVEPGAGGNPATCTASNSTFSQTAAQLSSGSPICLGGLTALPLTSTLKGVIEGVSPGTTYQVNLLDPAFPGTVIASTTVVTPSAVRAGSSAPAVVRRPSISSSLYTITFDMSPNTCTITFNGITESNGATATVATGTYPIVAQACSGEIFSSWASTAGSVSTPSSASTNLTVLSNGYLNATYSSTASYSISDLPAGTWTLYCYGAQSLTHAAVSNYTQVTLTGSQTSTVDINLTSYLVQGTIAPTDQFQFTNETNITLWDSATEHAYRFASYSNYFESGDFNSLPGTTSGTSRFVALLAPQGKSTAWRYVWVSSADPSANLGLIHVNPTWQNPPTQVATTLAFNASYSSVWVNSSARMTNDSVVPQLANAFGGDLYAQVGMDFNGGAVNATPSAWSAFENWLTASGPLYPANQENLMVNGSGFVETTTFSPSYSAQPANLDFDSSSSFWHNTSEAYQMTKSTNVKTSTHTLTMGFAYPTSTESLTYTVELPAGWVVSANAPVPTGTSLTAAGPGGTWTAFNLTSYWSPNGATSGTATVNLLRVGNVTAVVSVASPNFAFANRTNVVNQTHDNYTVIVGDGQNVSFSSADSLFPAGFNATAYLWNFGDSTTSTKYRENTTTWHTYTTAGKQSASLEVIPNTGQGKWQNFTVWVDNTPPTPKITSNDTHLYYQPIPGASNESFLRLNWSQSIRLNATNSTDQITSTLSHGEPPGSLADAIWNISAGPTYFSTNFSIGQKAASVFGNVTYQFNGAGAYYNSYTVNTSSGPHTYTVGGWVYRIVLKLYDAGGNYAYATLFVFVNDTEKPIPLGAIRGGTPFNPINEEGVNTTSGIELANHTCLVSLVDEWSSAPHNGTLEHYNWTITNKAYTAFTEEWFNATTDVSHTVDLPVPNVESTVTVTDYNLTLNVTDARGNTANVTYTFNCQLNQTIRPILQSTAINVVGGTTLTDGDKYTVQVNVSNQGGTESVAWNTNVSFNTETTSGGSVSEISSLTSVQWYGFVGGIVNSSQDFGGGAVGRIFYNWTYRAQITFTPSSSLSGTYKICDNATSSNEFPGSYKTGANIACVQVTFNTSPLNEILLGVGLTAVVAVVLIAIYFFWRQRTKGGSKKSGAGKGKKAEKDDDEDEEEDDEDEKPSSKGRAGKDDDDE